MVRRADSKVEKEFVPKAIAIEYVEAAAFTVRINESVFLNYRSIDAPLEPFGGCASDGAVWTAMAAIRCGVLEFPYRLQNGVQLGDVVAVRLAVACTLDWLGRSNRALYRHSGRL